MKKLFICFMLFNAVNYLHAQVGIGTTTPHTTAQLEISSNNKGLLIPRMTQAQRNAISAPATSLLVFQTDGTAGYYYFTGTAWQQLAASNNWNLSGNSGTTSSHFIGTIDFQPLIFKAGNEIVGQIKPGGSSLSIGYMSLKVNTGANNIAYGTSALEENKAGNNNTAMGYSALRMTTVGSYNTATGVEALYTNTTGSLNTAYGQQSLFSNSTASGNTAIGQQALYSNRVDANTGIGCQSLFSNSNGTSNTAVGYQALFSNTTRGQNTAVGSAALRANSTGFGSTAVGANALDANVDGTNNTAIGAQANVSAGNLVNATAIGYNAIVDASNKVQIGNTAVTSIGGQVSWTTLSDGRFKEDIKEDVPGLAFIKALRPITYTVNKEKLSSYLRKDKTGDANSLISQSTISRKRETGFIAQEVANVAKTLGFQFSGVDIPGNDSALYGIRYSEFVMPLVKAVQEQQVQIEVLQQKNKAYKEQIQAFQERLEKLEAVIHKQH